MPLECASQSHRKASRRGTSYQSLGWRHQLTLVHALAESRASLMRLSDSCARPRKCLPTHTDNQHTFHDLLSDNVMRDRAMQLPTLCRRALRSVANTAGSRTWVLTRDGCGDVVPLGGRAAHAAVCRHEYETCGLPRGAARGTPCGARVRRFNLAKHQGGGGPRVLKQSVTQNRPLCVSSLLFLVWNCL